MSEDREEQKILMSYEAWIGQNILEIDRAYNRGDFIRAHLGISTLYANMLDQDRKGLMEFIKERCKGSSTDLTPQTARDLLETVEGAWWETRVESEHWRDEWRRIYMAMIDYFARKGYLFKTRKFEAGEEEDVLSVGEEDT